MFPERLNWREVTQCFAVSGAKRGNIVSENKVSRIRLIIKRFPKKSGEESMHIFMPKNYDLRIFHVLLYSFFVRNFFLWHLCINLKVSDFLLFPVFMSTVLIEPSCLSCSIPFIVFVALLLQHRRQSLLYTRHWNKSTVFSWWLNWETSVSDVKMVSWKQIGFWPEAKHFPVTEQQNLFPQELFLARPARKIFLRNNAS